MNQFNAYIEDIASEGLVLRLWQSGRELFHSNVLAYLLESEQYGPRLLKYLYGDACKGYHVRALREHSGIDLLVVMVPAAKDRQLKPTQLAYWTWLASQVRNGEQARLLAIENKFKSLPDPAQLQGYSTYLHNSTDVFARKMVWYVESFSDGTQGNTTKEDVPGLYISAEMKKVILTPSKGEDISVPLQVTHTLRPGASQRRSSVPCPDTDVWVAKDWRRIARLIAKPVLADELEGQFVSSYSRSLRGAAALRDEIERWCQGARAFAQLDKLRRRAEVLRLHDFVDKWRYEFLTRQVRLKLRKAGWNERLVRNSRGLATQLRPAAEGALGTAVVETFFSRGTGGTDIALFGGQDTSCAVEVQLQSSTLKLMFAFTGTAADEPRQWMAVLRAISMLAAPAGSPFTMFAGSEHQEKRNRYVQKVGIRALLAKGMPEAVELEHADGRLLYAKAVQWKCEGETVSGEWARLSCSQIADQLALMVRYLAENWTQLQHLGRTARTLR